MGLLGTLGNVVGIDDLVHEIGETVRQVLPDKGAQRDFDLKLEEIKDRYQDRIHTEMMAQIDVNKAEAGHASIFVAGWRPAIGWICASGLAWNFVIAPFAIMVHLTPGMLPIESLMTLVLTMLGSSGIRTFELVKGVSRDSLKGPRIQGDSTPTPATTQQVDDAFAATVPTSDGDAPWNRK